MSFSLQTALFLTSFAAALASPSRAADALISWERHSAELPEGIWSVEAIDVNGDGKLDLIAMGETKVYALIAPEWKPDLLFDGKEPKFLYCVALDMDGDGDLDLALGRYRVPWAEYREARAAGKSAPEPKSPDFSLAWIENPGRDRRAWQLHILDRELNGIHGLCAADIDGDGKKDLISDSIMGPAFPKSLVWFNGGKQLPRDATLRHVITHVGADGRPHYLEVADLDGDGLSELLLGDSGGGTFTFWKRKADLQQPWTKHLIAKENGATNIRAARINRDSMIDVVGSCGHGRGVFWFEAPGWSKHPIDPEFATPHALACADFDGDGDIDVAAASFTALEVRWYENDGNGNFVTHTIDTGHQQQSYDMKTVDLDGDGRTDLILAGRETRNAVWFRNRK